MSAILGTLFRDGRPASRERLAEMAEPLAEAGPDGTGLWAAGPVGLGHLAHRTTPEAAHERMPRVAADGALALTADARLDNREELIAALGLEDARAGRAGAAGSAAPAEGRAPDAPITDPELILAAYRRWGDACPGRLLGDFAFAVWDASKRTLFCARDPLGVRPFFYHPGPRLFAFASRIGALRRLAEVPGRLDESTLADYLALISPGRVRTLYREIVRLPPGHLLAVSAEDSRVEAYWRLDPGRRIRLGSDAEYAEAFGEIFTDAVRRRLRRTGPAAAMLSGGLDSSAVACTARRVLDPGVPLHTYSGVFPSFRGDDGVDETPHIARIAERSGIEAHEIPVDRSGPLLDFLWRGDEPIPAATIYMDWNLLRVAREHGVRVLLNGHDGDTVVSHGTSYLAELAWTGRWGRLLRELKALSHRTGVSRRSLMRRYVLSTLQPHGLRGVWGRLRRNGGGDYGDRSVVHPELAARAGLADRIRRRNGAPARRARAAHLRGLDAPIFQELFESYAATCAPFGIEPRYPFFDRRLVEFCLALPGDQKLRDGWDRWILRRAMEGVLPPEIQWRKRKQNLSPNFRRRLLDDRETLDDVILGEDGSAFEDYIDVPALRARYRRYLDDPEGSDEAFPVFWAAVFALWLRESGVRA